MIYPEKATRSWSVDWDTLKLKYYSRNKDSKQLLYTTVKLVVFIVRGNVTWREIIF